jgi:hypothetical protein
MKTVLWVYNASFVSISFVSHYNASSTLGFHKFFNLLMSIFFYINSFSRLKRRLGLVWFLVILFNIKWLGYLLFFLSLKYSF